MKPTHQIVGTLEQDHFFLVLSFKTGYSADFTIKTVPLQTILFGFS
jgi:hypothetical protein